MSVSKHWRLGRWYPRSTSRGVDFKHTAVFWLAFVVLLVFSISWIAKLQLWFFFKDWIMTGDPHYFTTYFPLFRQCGIFCFHFIPISHNWCMWLQFQIWLCVILCNNILFMLYYSGFARLNKQRSPFYEFRSRNVERSSWSWSCGSWIYHYLFNQCLSPLKLWFRTPFMARCTRYNIMW
jgi:hypothetical protein